MRINYGVSGWPSREISLEEAFTMALLSRAHATGSLEELTARVSHLETIIRLVLTPEQILTLAKEFMSPTAFLCDLDKEQ